VSHDAGVSADPIRDLLSALPSFSVRVSGHVGILRARIAEDPERVDRWVQDHRGQIKQMTTNTGNRLRAGRILAEPPRHDIYYLIPRDELAPN
jgi:hypothetical protein